MSNLNISPLISSLSLEKHLKTYFQNDLHTSDEQKQWFILFGWLFDQIGIEAYSSDANRLVQLVSLYLKEPLRNKAYLAKNANLKRIEQYNSVSKWFTFLSFEAIENFIRPIHRKIMLQVRRAIEGMVAKEYDDPERTKQLTSLLKQLVSVDDNSYQSIILTETVPTQHKFDCKNKRCDNTVITYNHPLVKCLKCGAQQTEWNQNL